MERINRKRFLVIMILSTILIASTLFHWNIIRSSTISVGPGDSIQEAINNAMEGDTIFVMEGMYIENITINKTLNLVGENKETTIIDGNRAMTVVRVEANYVNISNFTLQNSQTDMKAVGAIMKGQPSGGIALINSVGSAIKNNTIQSCIAGITICNGSSYNTVINNYIKGVGAGFACWGVVSQHGAFSNMICLNDIVGLRAAGDPPLCGAVCVWEGSHNTIIGNRIFVEGNGIALAFTTYGYPFINNTISNNTISAKDNGIVIEDSHNNSIFNNTVSGKTFGILTKNFTNNDISNNTINGRVHMWNSDDNTLTDNTVSGGELYLNECRNNILRNNRVSSFGLEGSELSHFMNDIDQSNTINEKTIYYLINQSSLLISPRTYPNMGYLGIVNSKNITLWRSTITQNTQGLMLAQTTASDISEIHLSSNQIGMYLWNCSNNIIAGCTITSSETALRMILCNNNTIRGNTLLGNNIGIHMNEANNNTFYRNNFENAGTQIILENSSINFWDDRNFPPVIPTCPVCHKNRCVGNYWSDYAGKDDGTNTQAHNCPGDDIGDTDTPHQGVDCYPLMKPWTPVMGDFDYDGDVDMRDIARVGKNWANVSP